MDKISVTKPTTAWTAVTGVVMNRDYHCWGYAIAASAMAYAPTSYISLVQAFTTVISLLGITVVGPTQVGTSGRKNAQVGSKSWGEVTGAGAIVVIPIASSTYSVARAANAILLGPL